MYKFAEQKKIMSITIRNWSEKKMYSHFFIAINVYLY